MTQEGNTFPDIMLLPEIARIYDVIVDDLFKEQIIGYDNFAQRLLAVYEASGNIEDFIRADKEFLKLIELNNYTLDDLRSYGVMYHYMMNDCKNKAIQYFNKVIDENEKDTTYYRTWHQKIMLYSDIGKCQECIDIHKEALNNDINNPKQWTLLVAAYYLAGNNEKAYECVMKAIKKFQKEASLFLYAGDVCRSLKKYDEAFKYWDKVLMLDNTYLDAKCSKGFCYEEMGEYKKAYKIWMEIADDLKERGLVEEMGFPIELAKNCKEE